MYRWVKVRVGNSHWGTNNLTVNDLVQLKNGFYEAIIDMQEGTYYDPEQNDWIKISGESLSA